MHNIYPGWSLGVFINNTADGLGHSIYNNEHIRLKNIHIDTVERNFGYHVHSECGRFELHNMTMVVSREQGTAMKSGITSNGLFVASNMIKLSGGWNHTCPKFLNAKPENSSFMGETYPVNKTTGEQNYERKEKARIIWNTFDNFWHISFLRHFLTLHQFFWLRIKFCIKFFDRISFVPAFD